MKKTRRKFRMVAAAAFLTAAGCDGGGVVDQTIRNGVRQSAVGACAAWIPQSDVALAVGVDTERLCGCAADRVLQGKNASEIPNIRPDSAELRAAVAQCVAEVQKGGSAAEERQQAGSVGRPTGS